MTDLKRISILVLVLLNVSASIAYRHFTENIDELDSEGERQEQPVSSNRFIDVSKNLSGKNFQCSKTETNNELNAIIMDKVLKILELETVEREKELQTVGYDINLILWDGFGNFVSI